MGEKSLLLVDDCAERAGLAGAANDPRESLLGPNYRALRDHAAAVVVRVRGVAHDVDDVELLRLPRLWVGDVYDVRADDLNLLDSSTPTDSLELLLALECLYWVPADLVDAVCPVRPLLAARRLALC